MSALPTVRLRPGKEKKIHAGYPWVQRGELMKQADLTPGLARLEDSRGDFLAVGTLNPGRRFPFRVFSLKDEAIDEGFFHRRFSTALQMRQALIEGTNAFHLAHAEADGLPGFIADVYDGHAVVQVRSLGIESLRDAWLPALIDVLQPKSILERSEMAGRQEEGLQPRKGALHGEPPQVAEFHEDGLPLRALIQDGLKTGFYLDQRPARRLLAQRVKPGQTVLDVFCYTGAFSLHAARSGAVCTAVDLHEDALREAEACADRAGVGVKFIQANAFEWLEAGEEGGFDWIILDPPAIAKNSEKRDSLKWAIWKLVYNALPLLNPGGRMVVCSCSYQLGQHEMIDVCRLAASDRGEKLFLEGVTFQDTDHPALIAFPESLYLKCAWLRKA